jgi:hypothetical protein
MLRRFVLAATCTVPVVVAVDNEYEGFYHFRNWGGNVKTVAQISMPDGSIWDIDPQPLPLLPLRLIFRALVVSKHGFPKQLEQQRATSPPRVPNMYGTIGIRVLEQSTQWLVLEHVSS